MDGEELLCAPSSSAEKCEQGAVRKCQLGPFCLTRSHEWGPACLSHPSQVALAMRIHGKVAVIAVCFGLFLLLYFWGGNGAEDPLPKQVAGEEKKEVGNSPPSPSVIRRDVAAKFSKNPPTGVVLRPEGALKRRKEAKASSRGGDVKG